jgi:hypothetical protein
MFRLVIMNGQNTYYVLIMANILTVIQKEGDYQLD